jgi:hypothetical protein
MVSISTLGLAKLDGSTLFIVLTPRMALAKILFWAFLFAAATLCWVVVFEHGIGQFSAGFVEECRSIGRFFSRR